MCHCNNCRSHGDTLLYYVGCLLCLLRRSKHRNSAMATTLSHLRLAGGWSHSEFRTSQFYVGGSCCFLLFHLHHTAERELFLCRCVREISKVIYSLPLHIISKVEPSSNLFEKDIFFQVYKMIKRYKLLKLNVL